jgi:hypothetical protein
MAARPRRGPRNQRRDADQDQPEPANHRWPRRPIAGDFAQHHWCKACTNPYPITHSARNAPICVKLQPSTLARDGDTHDEPHVARCEQRHPRERQSVDACGVRQDPLEGGFDLAWPIDAGSAVSTNTRTTATPALASRAAAVPSTSAIPGPHSTDPLSCRDDRGRRPSRPCPTP